MARILVIDDEAPIRRVARRVLEDEGHEVLEASDGEAGLQLLAQQRPDLVITDVFMPGQDGIVLLRRVRHEFPSIRVIVVSGGDATGRLNLREAAELLGAVTSLPKPFSPAELLRTVREVLALPER